MQIGRVKKSLFILVLPFILILASCSAINSSKAVLNGLQVQLDENFSGPLSEWKKQFVYLKWNIESPPEIEKYRLNVIFRFSGEESTPLEAEFAYGGTNLESKPDSIAGEGTERVLTLHYLNKLFVFGAMADHSAGTNIDFKITLLQAKSDNDSVPIQATVSWKRPELKFASPTPKLEYVTLDAESAEPCYRVADQAPFSFDSRPQEYLVTINGKPYIDAYGVQSSVQAKLRNLLYLDDNKNLYVGVNCARTAGEKYVYEVISKNEEGSSNKTTLAFKSIKPGISQSEIDEANKSQKIGDCTGPLKITENSASYGDCGFIRVDVIQSDLDTGSCNFLGYWTDKNGSKRTGLFEYCGAFEAGGFQEDRFYTLYVKNNGSTSYKTRLGTNKMVLSFTVLDDK
jgi:hypothetical protein